MRSQRRRLAILCAGVAGTGGTVALAWPAISSAWLTEVGSIPLTTPRSEPSCPKNPKCEVLARTTGFQVAVGSETTLQTVPRNGTIVAWEVRMGNPNKTQIEYLDKEEGGESEAGLAVLEPIIGTKQEHVQPDTFKLVGQSPLQKLQPYFGKTAQFALISTIPVKKGDVIALTVPTWAPTLATGFTGATRWRASRPKEQCRPVGQPPETAQTTVGATANFACVYTTARLMYTATLVSTP